MKVTIKRIATIMMILMLIGNVLSPMNVYAADNSTVYVTRTGKCYHSSTCPTIQGHKVTAMTLAQAKATGHVLCEKCYATVSAAATVAPAAQAAGAASTAAVATAAAPAVTTNAAAVTPEQAVQQAYAMYMQSGMDSNAAFARVQAKVADFTAAPANYAAIVQSDLAAMKGAPAAAAISAEQAVAQAYSIYMQRGLDSATAFAKVQALVPQIVAAPSNYAQIVAAN